jgi:putative spermidine/putrescine transport system substrate-binding protein
MKKLWFLTALSVVAVAGIFAGGRKQEQQTLTISGFAIAEDAVWEYIIAPFEKQYNCKVVFESGNNAERLTKVSNNPNTEVDIIYLAQSAAQDGFKSGLFEKVDYAKIPNAAFINQAARFLIDQGQGPAYTWNRLGIIYNPDAVNAPITSFADLWREDLQGKITIPDITTTFGPAMVIIAAKRSGADYAADQGEAAFQALSALKPNLVKTYTRSSDLKNLFVGGEIVAAVAAEFAYNTLNGIDVKTEFVNPSEGPYLNFNTLNIIKNSKEKELAYAYLNYILSEEVQRIAAEHGIDAPINTQVRLTPNMPAAFTTAETAKNANSVDFAAVNPLLPAWVDRWNRTLNQ